MGRTAQAFGRLRSLNGLAAFGAMLAVIALVTLASRGPTPFFEPAEDARLRVALAGDWRWQFRDEASGDTVAIVVHRARDGDWHETITTSDAAGELRDRFTRRGRWFVAGGVLKTHTLYVDGQPVGRNSRQAFQNYPIEAIGADFVRYRVARSNGQPGQWQRVFERSPAGAPEQVVEERRTGEPPARNQS